MNTITLLAIATFVSWGVGSFVGKLAADKIGVKSVFWDLIGYIPAILIYILLTFKKGNALGGDGVGIIGQY